MNLTPDGHVALLERRLARAEAARREAESLLERRSRELDRSNRELRQREEELIARLDQGNRNLLLAQTVGGIATFYRIVGEPFVVSETVNQLFGRDPDANLSLNDVVSALHPLDRDRITALEDAFQNGEGDSDRIELEFRIRRGDGALRWLRSRQERSRDAASGRIRVSGTVEDITERRTAKRHADALRLMVQRNLVRLSRAEAALAERVAELETTAKALADSHERTEAAHRAKSRFLAQMSHNIRTPLNGVLGMMTALARSDLAPAQADQLARARRAGDVLQALIDTIIEIADAGIDAPLPVDEAPVAPRDSGIAPPRETSIAPLLVAGKRPFILVAEDIETNQIVLTSMLDTLGCDHLVVGDGAQALTALAQVRFDAVLMDIQMPVMDGAEAIRRIRAGEIAATVPIIGITAQAIQSEREALVAAGMTSCLAKPIGLAALAAALTDAFAPSVATPPLIDSEAFAATLTALPPARRPLLVDQMVRDLDMLAADFARGAALGDDDMMRRARHSLTGVAGNFGALALVAFLGGSRRRAADGDTLLSLVEETVAAARVQLAALAGA
jgi:PAS domain S-box-containing protein